MPVQGGETKLLTHEDQVPWERPTGIRANPPRRERVDPGARSTRMARIDDIDAKQLSGSDCDRDENLGDVHSDLHADGSDRSQQFFICVRQAGTLTLGELPLER